MSETQTHNQITEFRVGPEIKEAGEITEAIKSEFHNIKGVTQYIEDLAKQYELPNDTITYTKAYITLKRMTDAQMVPPEFSKLAFEVVGYSRKELNKGIQFDETDNQLSDEERREKLAEQKIKESDFYVTSQLLYKGYMPEDISQLQVNEKATLLRNVGREGSKPPSKTTNYSQENTLLNTELTDEEIYDRYINAMNEIAQLIGSMADMDKLSSIEKVQRFSQVINVLEQSGTIADQSVIKGFKKCADAAEITAGASIEDAETAAKNMFRKAIPVSELSDEEFNQMSLGALNRFLRNYNDRKQSTS